MRLARGAAVLGRAAADAALDGKQGGDPLQRLQRNRRGGGVMYLEEFAADSIPTPGTALRSSFLFRSLHS
jgi:hypothetical protein